MVSTRGNPPKEKAMIRMSPVTSRYLCIVCPNCKKPEPVPVYRVVWQGSTLWVCRSCMKWFPRE